MFCVLQYFFKLNVINQTTTVLFLVTKCIPENLTSSETAEKKALISGNSIILHLTKV